MTCEIIQPFLLASDIAIFIGVGARVKSIKLDDVQFEKRLDHEKAVIFDDDDFGSNTRVQLVRLGGGTYIKPHVHKVRSEVLQVVIGKGDVVVNGTVAATKPGEFVLIQPGDVHEVINRGKDSLVVAVFRINDPGDSDMIWVEEETAHA